jgi:hypothetical protein
VHRRAYDFHAANYPSAPASAHQDFADYQMQRGREAMNVTKTARGFALIDFNDGNGVKCSLQESSAAEREMIWLGCDEPNAKSFPGNGTGWHDYPLPENVQCTTRMHLTREQVAALLPHLRAFVDRGDLLAQSSATEKP